MAPSSLKEQDFENVSWSEVSREDLKQHLSSITTTLSDEVVEKTYKILSFHHQFMKEKFDKANTPSSTIAPNIIEHILSYRPDMGRFVYHFINCVDDGSEKMNLSELYPMVYIMLNQYFKPLDSRKNIASLTTATDSKIGYLLDCFDQMFRLLVQYHDPDLQLHFDRHRLEVIIDEIIPWSKSLLFDFIASSITDASELKQTLTYLLDILIIERDPVMYTFLIISILVRDRSNIMALDIPEELRSYCQAGLSSKEKQQIIKSKMDIFSLYLEAKNLEKETPISARNQLQSIYQASFEAKFDTMKQLLQESVILPLPATEIADCFTKDKTRQQQRSQNSKVKYLVIDCRSVKSFQYARLPTAIHVGTRVGYDNDKMKAILSKFEDAKGSHFVIFGTGRKLPEEENLLRVIAMKFVTGGFPHISIAVDGFKGCIKYMTSNLIEYVKDETLENTKTSSAEEWTSKVSETIFSWGKKAIGDIEEYVKEKKLVEQALTKLNSNKESALSTLNSLKNMEKKLEKTLEKRIKPVFSLGDNDSDDDISTSPTSVESTEATTVKLDDLSKLGDNIKLFTLQLKKNKETRYLAIGDNLIMCLKPHPQLFQSGIIQWKRTLRQVCKLTFKKTDATSLAFTLKGFPNTLSYTPHPQSTTDNSPPPSFTEQFTTDKATEIINLVQGNIKKLKENK